MQGILIKNFIFFFFCLQSFYLSTLLIFVFKGSVRFDKLESVSLPLPPRGDGLFLFRSLTLVELLSRLVSREKINDVQCDGCNKRCAAYKTLTFGKLPKCLCLHIQRTGWSSSGMLMKRDDPVIFNECLILDPFTYTETKRRQVKKKNFIKINISL